MVAESIFVPVLAQVVLTFVAYAALNVVKGRANRRGEVDLARKALHKDAYPDYVLKYTNNVANQFEAPVLFYVLAFMLWAVKAVDATTLTLAWAYVATRVVHYLVHTTINFIPVRKSVFTVGIVILLAMAVSAARVLLHI